MHLRFYVQQKEILLDNK